MRKTKEEAEATRQAILESAVNVFYEKGYSKTTFDEIAKRINLTKGAVYWYFRNKPDVIAAIINDYFQRQILYVEERQKELLNLNDILNHFLYNAQFILSNESNRKIAFFLSCQMEWSEAIIAKIFPQVQKNMQFWCNRLQQAMLYLQDKGEITQAIEADMLACYLMNNWNGLLGAYFGRRCTADLCKVIKESFGIIFDGMKTERTENASK